MSISTPLETRQIPRSKLSFEININSKINGLNSLADSTIASTLIAGEDIPALSLVYLDSAGLVKIANYSSFAAIGIVTQDLLEDDPVTLFFEGKLSSTAHGNAIGEKLFLTTGSPNYSDTLPSLTAGDLIQEVGYVIDSDTIYLDLSGPLRLE